jgi:site-specific DNA-cytosine methylase
MNWHAGVLGVTPWSDPACTITGRGDAACGAFSVGDPRIDELRVPHAYPHGYGVLRWDGASWTIAGGSQVGQGAYAVSDPRLTCEPRAGAYGVIGWQAPAHTVTGSADIDNSSSAVADPRVEVIDLKSTPKVQPIIIAADGTWHRALTTLELAALQGFPWKVNGSPLQLAGKTSSGWRTAIGNAVPPPTARAIAEQMLGTLLHADAGIFSLNSSPIWVAPESDDAPMELVQ